MRSFITCPLRQIKDDEMDRACSTHGAEEECMQCFDGKARRIEIAEKA
jgi:hypothetical protein